MFIAQVPPIGQDPYPCVERQSSVDAVEANCLSVTYAEAQIERTASLELALALAETNDSFEVFDPQPIFCTGEDCRLTLDGRMLYRDGNHLTAYGARQVAVPLAERISEIMRERFRDARRNEAGAGDE